MAMTVEWNMKALERIAEPVAVDLGKQTELEAKNSMHRGKSRPGSPPGVKTGELVRSLRTQVRPGDVAVVADALYSRELELGSRAVRARPFMVPALRRVMKRLGYGPK